MLENLKKSFERNIAAVGVQSNTYIEVSKLHTKIDNETQNMTRTFAELGRMTYQQWGSGNIALDCLNNMCKDLEKSEQDIAGFNAEIAQLEAEKARVLTGNTPVRVINGITCSCGCCNEAGSKFCSACGAPIAERLQQKSKLVCAECGNEIDKDTKFCPDCGARVTG